MIADFADLASGAATLSSDLKSCTDKPCKLNAIARFEQRFWDVERRGHFKLSPKLENIENILGGIIESAKIYYGAPVKSAARAGGGPLPQANPARELTDKINELKAAMKAN